MKGNSNYRIGEVYLINFVGDGSEQNGIRPGIIFQNNIGNDRSPNIVALPLTTAIKKIGQPTHVFLPSKKTGLLKDSVALCENPVCISKDKVFKYLTTLPDEYMAQIAYASVLASSAIAFMNPENLMALWEKAVAINNIQVTA